MHQPLLLLSVSDEVSSISGSDTGSSSDTDDTNTDVIVSSRLRSRRHLLLRNSAGQLLSFQQCLLSLFQVCAQQSTCALGLLHLTHTITTCSMYIMAFRP